VICHSVLQKLRRKKFALKLDSFFVDVAAEPVGVWRLFSFLTKYRVKYT
jgi:hypothetical protein